MNDSAMSGLQASAKLWISCLIEWLLFLPVWVLLEIYLQPDGMAIPWMYTLPLVSLAGVLLRHVLTRRWQQLLAALPIGAAAGLLCEGLGMNAVPLTAAGMLIAYLGMNAASRNRRLKLYTTGLCVYFAAAIIYARVPALQPSLTLLTWSGSLCLVLALLDSNISFLHYSSFAADSSRLPAGMRRINRVFVLLFVAVAAALAAGAGQAIGKLVWNVVRAITGWLVRLLSGGEETPEPEVSTPAAPPELPLIEAHERGLLSTILDVIFYGLGAAAVLLLLYLGLRWLYRNGGGLWRRAIDALLGMLRRESQHEQTGFQDEEESVFVWEKTVQNLRDYWRSRLLPGRRRDRWEAQSSGRERVRWLYREWLKGRQSEGYEVKGFLTPKETGEDVTEWSAGKPHQRRGDRSGGGVPEDLLWLYNQARYGGEEPSPADVSALKERLKG